LNSGGSKKLGDAEKKIEDILKLGDKEQLVREIQGYKKNIMRSQGAADRALKDLSLIMRNPDMSASMIMKPANKGLEILNDLNKNKQLPKVNIPILEELLDRANCFCGADLSEQTAEGKIRHQSIETAIEKSRSSDALQESASSLFYSVRSEPFDTSVRQKWIIKYSDACENYEQSVVSFSDLEQRLQEKEKEKDKINDEQLQALRQQEQTLKRKLNTSRVEVGALSEKISDAKGRISDLKREQQVVESKLNKNDTSTDKLQLSRLTKTVFENIFDFLRKNEVKRVSDEMNRIFLDMIGADPDNNHLATITKAELTEEFDILVYGSNGHKLNPDQDLNGASRRAITLAFILALTKVSEVKAPNVIDTPLGMMSGYVKQSVLNKTLEEGSQIILFLTHDEIQGVESILDNKAGIIYTLTNPAHSKMLVHPSAATDIGVIRCACNHRESCVICARKNIDEIGN
jgi:DNA sulfur modification protein DndD